MANITKCYKYLKQIEYVKYAIFQVYHINVTPSLTE